MTNVIKTSETAARHTATGGENRGTEPKRGEFDRMLDSRKDARSEVRTERSPGRGEGGREAEPGNGGSPSGQDSPAEPVLRALPGDVAMATPIRWEPAPAPTSPSVRSAEMVARLEQIAQQIVQSAEVRLGAHGAAEARLELNLGSLGGVSVSLARGEDGALRVAFQNATAEAATTLQTHASELLGRLEARGLVVQEITVQGADRPDFRLAPSAPSTEGPKEGEPGRQGFEDERRRRQPPDAERPSEDE